MGNERLAVRKQIFRAAFARTSLEQARLACEFILNHPGIDQATYNILITGFTITYARLFDGGNAGIGHLPIKFGKFSDPGLQGTHEALCAARNLFVAHLNASYKYCDAQGVEKDHLLALAIVVGPADADGMSDVRTQITMPEVPRDNIPRYKSLCEDLIQRIAVEEQSLLKKLCAIPNQLKIGVNRINLFEI